MAKKFLKRAGKKLRERSRQRKNLRKKARKTRQKNKQKKKAIAVYFVKPRENPIISPNPQNYWEKWQTFNPGVILLNNKIHFLYRAIGEDGISRLGYAVSDDGFVISRRLSYPVYEHKTSRANGCFYYSFASGGSLGGCEDPRIVRVDNEDTLYMTYTACDEGLRVGLTSIKTADFLKENWNWKKPVLISPPGEVNKNWVIFPSKIKGKYAILHSISPKISIAYRDNLNFRQGEYIKSYYNGENENRNHWDGWVKGAGAPPIKTEKGWLLFYHAIDKNEPGKYKVGAMLLDLENPAKILYRASDPILEPDKLYENNGFKSGIVYVSGAVVKDDNLLLYYGASDSYVSVAWANLKEFLEILIKKKKPKLKARRTVIRKENGS